MSMARQIFRYGITIAVVVGISLGYAYRQQLFPMFFDANQAEKIIDANNAGSPGEQSPATTVQSVPEPAKQLPVKTPVPEPAKQLPVKTPAPEPVKQLPAKTSVPEKSVPGEADSVVKKPAVIDVKVPGGKTGQDKPVNMSVSPEVPPAQQQWTTGRVQPRNHMQGQREMAPSAEADYEAFQQKQEKFRQYLTVINKARQVYWQGKYKESIGYYKQAIKLIPENPEAYGELGNLYYSQGEWQKAGESLYQSASRLLDNGLTGKVYHLLTIIRGLKPERAKELENRLKKLSHS